MLVDLDILGRNISRMAEAARRHGIRLRPHGKTHKVPEVARMQIEAGAAGLCLAKAGEAEVFADAGFDDVFLAYPVVGADKARRLLALADRLRLRVGADSVDGARTLSEVFHHAGRRLDILLKVDVGSRPVGVLPEDALETARRIADLPGLRLRGVFTHPARATTLRPPKVWPKPAVTKDRRWPRSASRYGRAGFPWKKCRWARPRRLFPPWP